MLLYNINSCKQNNQMSIEQFKSYASPMIEEGVFSEDSLDALIEEVLVDSTDKSTLNFDHFLLLDSVLQDAAQIEGMAEDGEDDMSADGSSTSKSGSESDEVMDDDEPTAEELDEMARDLFDELKSEKSGKLSVKKFKKWDGIKEEIGNGALTVEAIDNALRIAGVEVSKSNTGGEMNFNQFKEVMDMLEEVMYDGEDDEEDSDDEDDDDSTLMGFMKVDSSSGSTEMTGKGFARPEVTATGKKNRKGTEMSAEESSIDDTVREVYEDLKGTVRIVIE